jgi:hypothetical protein
MMLEYGLDLTQQVIVPVTASDSTFTVPVDPVGKGAISNPNNVGSLWYLSAQGLPVSLNIGAPAVAGQNFTVPVGNFGGALPLNLPPGATIHVISTAAATLTICRARRKS